MFDNYLDFFQNDYCLADTENHSMGDSLYRYLDIKVNESLLCDSINEIHVVGEYDRSTGISEKEKKDKLFNYKRPTIIVDNDIAYVKCYPGIDYVYHYASIIKSFLLLNGLNTTVITEFPSMNSKRIQLENSNLKLVPSKHTAILGYVQGLEFLSKDLVWHGDGDFKWKEIDDNSILLGCEHSYWGEIAGEVVKLLAELGFKRVIYSGKLGTLNYNYLPNVMAATGDTSVFMDDTVIKWDNLFEPFVDDWLKKGIHFTLPSIIQETKKWVLQNSDRVDFVDPEIGHMAKAALDSDIQFSYIHIISDNLVRKFDDDLSNERKRDIIEKRKVLMNSIGNTIRKI